MREQIATQTGSLNRELGRTKVRGSFAQQSRANLGIDAGRALADKEAEIENQRISALSQFLEIDAGLLKEGLSSESGRLEMLSSLEESLKGVSVERFNQEMEMLGLPTQYGQMLQADAAAANAATGSQGAMASQLLGDTLGMFTGGGGGSKVLSVSGSGSTTGPNFMSKGMHKEAYSRGNDSWASP